MNRVVNKYTITSASFTGEIVLEYCALTDRLVTMAVLADLSPTRHEAFLQKLPLTRQGVKALQAGGIIVNHIKADVTFEQFWQRYDYKVDKETAHRRWNNLTLTDRIKAYNFIMKYKQTVKPGIDLMYPSTYLSKKRWND